MENETDQFRRFDMHICIASDALDFARNAVAARRSRSMEGRSAHAKVSNANAYQLCLDLQFHCEGSTHIYLPNVSMEQGIHMSAWQQLLKVGMVLAFPCAASAADDFPHRQAGSWETTIVVSGKSATTRQCVSDTTDKLINAMQPPAGGTCSKRTLEKTSDGYLFEYSCKVGAVTMDGKTVITGDMDTAFKLESTSVRTGMPNQPGSLSRTITATAHRLGPC